MGLALGLFLRPPCPLPETETIFISDPSFPNSRYNQLDRILQEASAKAYTRDYRCEEFTDDLQKRLERNGIASEKVSGFKGGGGHAWNCIWIEPQTGDFVSTGDGYYREE